MTCKVRLKNHTSPSFYLYLHTQPLSQYKYVYNYLFLTACSHTSLHLQKSVQKKKLIVTPDPLVWSTKTLILFVKIRLQYTTLKSIPLNHLSCLFIRFTRTARLKEMEWSTTSNVENTRVAFMPLQWLESNSSNSLQNFSYDPYAGIFIHMHLYIHLFVDLL